eukprot:8138070-Pyramimonas_sp.AAC.1
MTPVFALHFACTQNPALQGHPSSNTHVSCIRGLETHPLARQPLITPPLVVFFKSPLIALTGEGGRFKACEKGALKKPLSLRTKKSRRQLPLSLLYPALHLSQHKGTARP